VTPVVSLASMVDLSVNLSGAGLMLVSSLEDELLTLTARPSLAATSPPVRLLRQA